MLLNEYNTLLDANLTDRGSLLDDNQFAKEEHEFIQRHSNVLQRMNTPPTFHFMATDKNSHIKAKLAEHFKAKIAQMQLQATPKEEEVVNANVEHLKEIED